VTRTFHFGTPTEKQRRAFTRVLQGHISIDTAVFPSGTTGTLLVVSDGQSGQRIVFKTSRRVQYVSQAFNS
jgi:hypothetical protein